MPPSVIATLVVAVLHVGFFVLESILWTTPIGRHVFGTTPDEAETTKVMAANQGAYNLGAAALLVGFLAAGSTVGVHGVLLFLVVMGVVGALTAKWEILVVQSLPAAVALGLGLTG